MSQNKEWISLIAAAQRLGCTVEEVELLVKGKKLESKTEYGRTQVTKQSVYDLSGLKNDGRQTAKKRGPKPARLSFAEAAAELGTDEAQIQALTDELKLDYACMDDATDGVTRKSVETLLRKEPPKADTTDFVPCGIKEEEPNGAASAQSKVIEQSGDTMHTKIHGDDGAFSKDEVKEAVDIAYRLGKLAVYESLESFERRLA